jgi:hypothetical protein
VGNGKNWKMRALGTHSSEDSEVSISKFSRIFLCDSAGSSSQAATSRESSPDIGAPNSGSPCKIMEHGTQKRVVTHPSIMNTLANTIWPKKHSIINNIQ